MAKQIKVYQALFNSHDSDNEFFVLFLKLLILLIEFF